jgi:hypothetical protein
LWLVVWLLATYIDNSVPANIFAGHYAGDTVLYINYTSSRSRQQPRLPKPLMVRPLYQCHPHNPASRPAGKPGRLRSIPFPAYILNNAKMVDTHTNITAGVCSGRDQVEQYVGSR